MTPRGDAPPYARYAIDWRNIIQAGRDMLVPKLDLTAPTDEHIRGAVREAYYAMFHALATSNADVLIGAPTDAATENAWIRVYRGLDHGTARRELQRHRPEFSAGAQRFSNVFQEMQDRRHSADYDPTVRFTNQQAAEWLTLAETTITAFLETDRNERAYIAALTLVRGR